MPDLNFSNTPKTLKDSDNTYLLLNTLARQGYYVDVEQRSHDWIAFIHDHPEIWESGKDKDEAVSKIYQTIKSWFKSKE